MNTCISCGSHFKKPKNVSRRLVQLCEAKIAMFDICEECEECNFEQSSLGGIANFLLTDDEVKLAIDEVVHSSGRTMPVFIDEDLNDGESWYNRL